jgi:diguanylate cyclase (GGDEF)-like protein
MDQSDAAAGSPDPPPSGGVTDARLTRVLAEFHDSDLEHRYRLSGLAETGRMLTMTLLFGLAVFVLFGLVELAQLGLSMTTFLLFVLRVVLVVLIISYCTRLRSTPGLAISYSGITVIECWAMATFLLTSALRPEEFEAHNLNMLVLVGALFIFIPNRWLNVTVVCAISVVVYLAISTQVVQRSASARINDSITVVVMTVLCALVARKLETVRRKEYASLIMEREANQNLIEEITRRQALEDELMWMANHDPLSDLLNRRAFFEQAEREVARSRRSGLPLSLIIIDADEFKSINDRFGHHTGDEAIKRIAAACKAHLRADDLLGRIGGEEFAALLPAAGIGLAGEVSRRLCAAIHDTVFEHPLGLVPLSVSIGVTECRVWEEAIPDSLQRADEALYEAKRSGRNCVVPAI